MANEAGSTVAGKPTTFVFVAFFQDLFQVLRTFVDSLWIFL